MIFERHLRGGMLAEECGDRHDVLARFEPIQRDRVVTAGIEQPDDLDAHLARRQMRHAVGAAHQRETHRRAFALRRGRDRGEYRRMRARPLLPQVDARRDEQQHARRQREILGPGFVGAHEFGGGTTGHQRESGLEPLFEFDLSGELGICHARVFESIGFRLAHLSRDVAFDQLLVHRPRSSRSRLVKPRSSMICLNRRRARLSAWLNAASLICIS